MRADEGIMDKKEIVFFFDTLSPLWDGMNKRNERVIKTLLDNARIEENCSVLDVATGTGVLISDYLSRKVKQVVAIDSSAGMIKKAQAKFNQEAVTFYTSDVIEFESKTLFDRIVIYNAFPHFDESLKVLEHLNTLLSKEGIVTIAHGQSRDKTNACHHKISHTLSKELPPLEELCKLVSSIFEVTDSISDDEMYQIVAKKR